MLLSSSQTPAPTAKDSDVETVRDVDLSTFMVDVIEASKQNLIVVDFWAPWCEPCKQLGPVIEKLVRAYNGALHLAKINIDQNPEIAQQMGVQSIPAVFAFYKGRPLDGFMGALPEVQIKSWIDRLIKATGIKVPANQDSFDEALKYGADFLAEKNFAAAEEVFTEILATNPEHPEAYAGMVRCLIGSEDLVKAEELLKNAPEKISKNPALDSVRAALELALQTQNIQPTTELEKKIQEDPKNYQARFDLAMTYYAAGEKQQAVDHLLEIVKLSRTWNDDAARKQLVKFFEAFGVMDPITVAARKRLSSLLFS